MELDGSIDWDDLHPATKSLLSRRRFLAQGGRASLVLFGAFNLVLTACGGDDGDGAATTTAAAGGTASTAAGATTTAAATATTAAGTKTLYERLGGNAAISAVMTDFVDEQVVPDKRINAFFAGTDLTRLKQLLTEFAANATGGAEKYTGRDMKSSHAGLGITMADFNALVEDLSKSLDVFKVPAREKGELLAALAALSKDIVTA
jgi:hemoglobin